MESLPRIYQVEDKGPRGILKRTCPSPVLLLIQLLFPRETQEGFALHLLLIRKGLEGEMAEAKDLRV